MIGGDNYEAASSCFHFFITGTTSYEVVGLDVTTSASLFLHLAGQSKSVYAFFGVSFRKFHIRHCEHVLSGLALDVALLHFFMTLYEKLSPLFVFLHFASYCILS